MRIYFCDTLQQQTSVTLVSSLEEKRWGFQAMSRSNLISCTISNQAKSSQGRASIFVNQADGFGKILHGSLHILIWLQHIKIQSWNIWIWGICAVSWDWFGLKLFKPDVFSCTFYFSFPAWLQSNIYMQIPALIQGCFIKK